MSAEIFAFPTGAAFSPPAASAPRLPSLMTMIGLALFAFAMCGGRTCA